MGTAFRLVRAAPCAMPHAKARARHPALEANRQRPKRERAMLIGRGQVIPFTDRVPEMP